MSLGAILRICIASFASFAALSAFLYATLIAEYQPGTKYNAMVSVAGLLLMISAGGAIYLISRLFKDLSKASEALDWVTNQSSNTLSQINSFAESLADSAFDQAGVVQQTFSATEDLEKSAQRVSNFVKECHSSSKQARSVAEAGKVSLLAVNEAIDEINEATKAISAQVENSSKHLKSIVEAINEIGGKTNIINDIAFQTKLLSFNASVEAARAGEHGRGFAVVAEQIGSLAQTSSVAATEIESLLDSSSAQVQEIIFNISRQLEDVIDRNHNKIQTGKRLTQDCNVEYDALNETINNLDSLVGQIAELSVLQSASTNSINSSMANIAASAEKAATNTKETTRHVFSMRKHINQYTALSKIIASHTRSTGKSDLQTWDDSENGLIMVNLDG